MSDKPFYFSVKLPEGNYRVTVTLGDPCGESVTTIKAELRRLMLEQIRTRRGELATRVLAANVRTPAIAGGGEVRLKDREWTSEAWPCTSWTTSVDSIRKSLILSTSLMCRPVRRT